MDIKNEIFYWILVWILALADFIMLIVLVYSVYLFRKSTYDFEQEIKNSLKHKK
jgi:hypothetical protein